MALLSAQPSPWEGEREGWPWGALSPAANGDPCHPCQKPPGPSLTSFWLEATNPPPSWTSGRGRPAQFCPTPWQSRPLPKKGALHGRGEGTSLALGLMGPPDALKKGSSQHPKREETVPVQLCPASNVIQTRLFPLQTSVSPRILKRRGRRPDTVYWHQMAVKAFVTPASGPGPHANLAGGFFLLPRPAEGRSRVTARL